MSAINSSVSGSSSSCASCEGVSSPYTSPIYTRRRSSSFEEGEKLDELSGERLSPQSQDLIDQILSISLERPISQPPSPISFQVALEDEFSPELSPAMDFLKNVCNFLGDKKEFLYQKEALDEFINEITAVNWDLTNEFPELLQSKIVQLVEAKLEKLFTSNEISQLETHVSRCSFKKRVFKLIQFREVITEIVCYGSQEAKILVLSNIISQLIERKHFKTAIEAAKFIPDCQVKDKPLSNPKSAALETIRNAALAEGGYKEALKAQNAMPSISHEKKVADFRENFEKICVKNTEIEIRVINGKLKIAQTPIDLQVVEKDQKSLEF